ncbi:MAG: sugar transferase [Planctomycetota bacterium]|jgi:lipopolysaccharide/colanic/teichoic acid biosynthesis glycosyltransferase
MRLIVVRESRDAEDVARTETIQYALSTAPLRGIVLWGAGRLWCDERGHQGFSELLGRATPQNTVLALPQRWQGQVAGRTDRAIRYATGADIDRQALGNVGNHPWSVVSSGRFATHINALSFERVLAESGADALAVTVTPELLAYRERVRLTERGELVGYRRLYRDSSEPMPIPLDWPHHLFIRTECIETVLADGVPSTFAAMIEKYRSAGLNVRALAVAGSVVDLGSPDGLLALSQVMFKHAKLPKVTSSVALGSQVYTTGSVEGISPDARFIGFVLVGDVVRVEPGAVIVGPSILCDRSTVRRDAVADASILGAGAVLERKQTLTNSLVTDPGDGSAASRSSYAPSAENELKSTCPREARVFRTWSRWSYARCFKRIADIVVAAIVLILFIPVIPLMALAIKMSSPGPVFFKDKRQGLHGRLFDCVKFRTMRVGAADIQDKLRFVSEVDGPQFKMEDDPRISTVGWFLRETYLDEIPQFFNVLCGQMSVVGPRPSPEAENTLCPSWRDARLSVRPGITGLWQVNRTRRPFRDFQEWIHYDTQYVQQLSPRMDLRICWRTFKRMLGNFAAQF